MSEKDEKIFELLVAGGLIGAALGALIAKSKRSGATIGAIAGAAILATFKANEQAKKYKLPVFIEEDGKLFEVQPDGEKKFIKLIPKHKLTLEKNFKLT